MCHIMDRRGTKSLIAIIGLTLIGYITACGRTMLRANGISQYEKQIILDLHNNMRQSIALGQVGGQPPASNMMEMKWDDELASRAQNWAVSCSSGRHDEQRHVSRFPVGQNLASTWTTKPPTERHEAEPDWPNAMSKWFNEFRQFSFGGVGRGSTGHYTQMIWANTNLVGCGYAFYYDQAKGYTKNYVCNYGPGGNILGRTPYEKGYPNCPESGLSQSSKYSGLCDNKRESYIYGISNYIG